MFTKLINSHHQTAQKHLIINHYYYFFISFLFLLLQSILLLCDLNSTRLDKRIICLKKTVKSLCLVLIYNLNRIVIQANYPDKHNRQRLHCHVTLSSYTHCCQNKSNVKANVVETNPHPSILILKFDLQKVTIQTGKENHQSGCL